MNIKRFEIQIDVEEHPNHSETDTLVTAVEAACDKIQKSSTIQGETHISIHKRNDGMVSWRRKEND